MDNKSVLNDLPRWDLSDLYSSGKDPQLNEDKKKVADKIYTFVSSYGELFLQKDIDSHKLYDAIVGFENISEMLSKLMSFAGLQYYSDLNNEDFKNLYQNLQESLTPASTKLIFFSLGLANLSEDSVNKALKENPKLEKYAHFFALASKQQPHQLAAELESYIAEKAVSGRQAWVRLYDETLAQLTLEYNGEKLPLEAVVTKMGDKNPAIRKNAALSLHQGLLKNRHLLSTITNVLAKDKATDDKWRKFSSPMDSRHLDNQVEPKVVDTMVETVVQAYPSLSHRYYALKAKMLGMEKLEYWDRNAPIPFDDSDDITWAEAKKIVLDAYASFSPELTQQIQPFFDKNWIDVPTTPGKTSGAFSHPTVPSAHPYVLLNFQGKRRDVMTLAHELGHGAHQMLAREQGYLLADTPLTLAETASVFGEMLTFQHMLDLAPNDNTKISLLAGKIDDMLNTVVRQVAFYRFEVQVHNQRQQGELNGDDLDAIFYRTQTEALGPHVHMASVCQNFWGYISHFIHTPFYVYAYAFGDCLVNSLYAYYRENPHGFAEKYLDLLRAGGSKPYQDMLSPFGFDLRQPKFWQQGLSMISQFIDQLEKMIGKK